MIDFELAEDDSIEFDVADGLDTAILYVYEGAIETANDQNHGSSCLEAETILLLDADEHEHKTCDKGRRRGVSLTTTPKQTACVMLFAGKKLREPIAWRGPIVMNTQEQIYETFGEMKQD